MTRSVVFFFAFSMVLWPQAWGSTTVENFSITGAGFGGSGTITLTTTGSPGVDDITGISGYFFTTTKGGFSGAITELSPSTYSASAPEATTLSDYDNLFYPTGASATCVGDASSGLLLDACGLDFVVGGSYEVNLYANLNGLNGYQISDGALGGKAYDDFETVAGFTTSPTPEPSGWILLATACLGIIGREALLVEGVG